MSWTQSNAEEPVDYDKTPVHEFGAKMLCAMGWREGQVVGRNQTRRPAKPLEPAKRPMQLGLGARSAADATDSSVPQKEREVVGPLRRGSLARVLVGRHRGVRGVVVEVEPMHVLLTMEHVEQRIRVRRCEIELLSAEAYDTTDVDAPPPKRDAWASAGLRVRIVSKTIQDGRLFKAKGYIEDVLQNGATVNVAGRVFDHIPENALETILPTIGGRVRIVRGARKGEMGTLKSKNRDTEQCMVELDDEFAAFDYDDVCEVRGD